MYPINLSIEGKLCFVVGGGRVALRKIRGLLAERAMVTVIAPEIVPELTELWQKKDIFWCKEPFQVGKNMLLGAHLVFCATDSAMVNRQAADEAHSIGALVNSATDKEDCDFQPGMRCLFQYIVDIFANFALCYTLVLLVCLFIGIEEIVVRPAGSPGTFPEKNFLLLSWQKPYLYCSLHFSLPRQ